jgi:hypothetical protein
MRTCYLGIWEVNLRGKLEEEEEEEMLWIRSKPAVHTRVIVI